MSAIVLLAGAFATIIAVGCAAVYLHDALEDRGSQVVGSGGGGQRVPQPWRAGRGVGRLPTYGKVVWVRAGDHDLRRVTATAANTTRADDAGRPERSRWQRG